MKASPHFVSVLRSGLASLRDKYGHDAVANAPLFSLFHAIGDSVRPGMQHNAKFAAPIDEDFHAEAMRLDDAHIETAMKAAIK